jgi:hypothetical protein
MEARRLKRSERLDHAAALLLFVFDVLNGIPECVVRELERVRDVSNARRRGVPCEQRRRQGHRGLTCRSCVCASLQACILRSRLSAAPSSGAFLIGANKSPPP